nr:MAG TPA: hypothetical protein [Caudoviricetes sp.]
MKIIDTHGNPIENPDLTKGYLKPETQTIHHDAVAGMEEVSHYETETLPDGTPAIYYDADGREKGRDVRKVVDVPGVAAKGAYDEEVDVQRYVLYTAEELAAQAEAKKKAEEAAAAEAKKKAELEAVPGRVDALEAANDDIVLMMADLIGGRNE